MILPVWLQFPLLLLAVFRVAVLVAWDEGPFRLAARWRDRLGQKTWVGRGFHCPACVSFWLAWPAAALLPWQGWAWYIVAALALSGGTVVLARLGGR